MTAQRLPVNRILRLALGFQVSAVLCAAVELGVFETLSSGQRTATELRNDLGIHHRAAMDFFDVLVALNMLERDLDGRLNLTEESRTFLVRSAPAYLGGVLISTARTDYRTWQSLAEALRSGGLRDESDHDLFPTLYRTPEETRLVAELMSGLSVPTASILAQRPEWSHYRSFADIGCSQGYLAAEVAAAQPHLTGTGFDLPAVRPLFEEFVTRRDLAARLSFQPGNFFFDDLPTADVVILSRILHDWGLADRKSLIAKCHKALPPGGMLIVQENFTGLDEPTNVCGLLSSLVMLLNTAQGSDFLVVDCVDWLAEAGFRDLRVEPVGPESIVIGIR